MQIAYRQIAALFLGALILLTSLHYMLGWSRLYDAYRQHCIVEPESASCHLAQAASSTAEKRIALTRCAALLEGDAQTAVEHLVGESAAPSDGLQLSITEQGQPLAVGALLEKANQAARYQLRYRGKLNYIIEVNYD